MMPDTYKTYCAECGWRGMSDEQLRASNPFSKSYGYVHGCPGCYAIDQFTVACEHEGCWKESTCGTPTATHYAFTCGEHVPVDQVTGTDNG